MPSRFAPDITPRHDPVIGSSRTSRVYYQDLRIDRVWDKTLALTEKTASVQEVREAWLARTELALIDVREEAEFAEGHPLFATSIALGALELEVYDRVPRRKTAVVCYSAGDDRDVRACERLRALGYLDVRVLAGGLNAWREAGYELFRDVNSPSKAFGELVAATCHTPSISPLDFDRALADGRDLVVVDARRFEEYQTMSIPGAISVPGGELVLRVHALAPGPETQIVVNCAGRTRSIIGTQSLRNAGYKNPVAALRNGTIGWTLAGLELDHGAALQFPSRVEPREELYVTVRAHAESCGVRWLSGGDVNRLREDRSRTTYLFDVRDPAEFDTGHLAGFKNAPGGQLVQETDAYAPVRGAQIVLADDDGIRAAMCGSWLAQMGWSVAVVTEPQRDLAIAVGPYSPALPAAPTTETIAPPDLARVLRVPGTRVIDLARSTRYRAGHIPGAAFALRHELGELLTEFSSDELVVITSPDGAAAKWAVHDLGDESPVSVAALEGGTSGWSTSGFALDRDDERFLSRPIDVYRRPYEGTDIDPATMQAYLDWEYGLVDQLQRDGTHHFFVVCAA